jgi:hypothetical protein
LSSTSEAARRVETKKTAPLVNLGAVPNMVLMYHCVSESQFLNWQATIDSKKKSPSATDSWRLRVEVLSIRLRRYHGGLPHKDSHFPMRWMNCAHHGGWGTPKSHMEVVPHIIVRHEVLPFGTKCFYTPYTKQLECIHPARCHSKEEEHPDKNTRNIRLK